MLVGEASAVIFHIGRKSAFQSSFFVHGSADRQVPSVGGSCKCILVYQPDLPIGAFSHVA